MPLYIYVSGPAREEEHQSEENRIGQDCGLNNDVDSMRGAGKHPIQ